MAEEHSNDFVSAEDNERKMIEILSIMDQYHPLIPEELIDYYFTKAGIQCDDVRIKRLVSVIGQKFLSDITSDAVKYSKLRTNNPSSSQKPSNSKTRQTFTFDDLTFALNERGIQIKRPPYHQ